MTGRAWGKRLTWGAVALIGAGCHACGGADHREGPAGPPSGAAEGEPSAAVASTHAADGRTPIDDWREAARRFEWERAHQLLAALPPAERDKPSIRLARGQVALEAGHPDVAVTALSDLAKELPLAKEEIERAYARAAAAAGPHEQAAKIYERSAKVRDLLRAAEAWKAAGNMDKARAVADRAVRLAQRTRRKSDEEHAHEVRGQIAEETKKVAVAAGDYRWLVQNAQSPKRVRAAIAGVDRVGGVITVQERVEGLARSCDADNLKATLEALDELAKKHAPEAAFIALGRARAIYRTRDYAAALVAFDEAAKKVSAWIPEAQYYAARAASRSGNQDEGVKRYGEVALRHRSSPWAERAAYRRAQLLLVMGKFAEAADAFARYAARYGRSPDANNAVYGRALALLGADNAKEARKLLTNLRDKASERRDKANLQHLEALAAQRAGEQERAVKLWLELVREQPLTFPALAAHARLATTGHSPMPPLIDEPKARAASPLPVVLPEAPSLFRSLGLDMLAEQRLSRMEQEAAQRFGGRESEALCEMYGQLSGAARRHQIGTRAVSLEVLMRPPSSAERWAWNCVYPDPYPEIVRREERSNGLPNGLIYAIMRQESAFKSRAVSPVGARGLMQLMPNTAARAATEVDMDFDPSAVTRPDVNVKLGAHYIAKLIKAFGDSVPVAVAAYNAGPHAVHSWLGAPTERELDLWVARIPYAETREYVRRVIGNLSRYQYLAKGSGGVMPLPLVLPAPGKLDDDAY